MTTAKYHLAQINIAKTLAPLSDPIMAGFVNALDRINALADASPGFVWRFQTEEGDATGLRPYDDEHIIVNFSVWETIEDLKNYVYKSAHAEVMKQRRQWFEKFAGGYMVLWWVEAGHLPTILEAKARLDYLNEYGPSATAFTFSSLYPAPDQATNEVIIVPFDSCPVT